MQTITISTDLLMVIIGFIAIVGGALAFVEDVWKSPVTGLPAIVLFLGGGVVFLIGLASGFVHGVS